MDRPFELLALLLQPPHSLNVLDAHTFHVLQEGDLQIYVISVTQIAKLITPLLNYYVYSLGSTSIDVSFLIFMGRKGWIGPVLRENLGDQD